jgi:hypothetical protein
MAPALATMFACAAVAACGSDPEAGFKGTNALTANNPPSNNGSQASGTDAGGGCKSDGTGCQPDPSGGSVTPSGGPTDAGSTTPPPPVDAGPACVSSPFSNGNPWSAWLQDGVPVEGDACLDCHTHPSAPWIPFLEAGGRVYDSSGRPKGGCEVRITGANGKTVSVMTNAQGNFWWPPIDGYSNDYGQPPDITFPATVGVKSGGTTTSMCAAASHGNCNACHDGKTTSKVH